MARPKPLTEVEDVLICDLYRRGVKWMIRQPSGDLVGFKSRPVRQLGDVTNGPWIERGKRVVKAQNRPILISTDTEDFRYVRKSAIHPTSVIDIVAKHNMTYLWEDTVV